MDIDEIDARLSELERLHEKFFLPGRHMLHECDLCWLFKTMRALMRADLLDRIRKLTAETDEMRRELDELKKRRTDE